MPPLPIQYSIEEAVAAAFGTSELEAGALAGHLSTHREGYGRTALLKLKLFNMSSNTL